MLILLLDIGATSFKKANSTFCGGTCRNIVLPFFISEQVVLPNAIFLRFLLPTHRVLLSARFYDCLTFCECRNIFLTIISPLFITLLMIVSRTLFI